MRAEFFDLNTATRIAPTPNPQDNDRRLSDLRTALKGAAPSLVRDLFPLARFQGNEARIGSADGEAGESMSIVLSGEKAGQWFDHNPVADVREGDLITLWEMGQRRTFMEAVEDLELHLGLRAGAKWTGPVYKAIEQAAKTPKPPEPTKTLEATYDYVSVEGEVLAQVLRYRLSNGRKTFSQRNERGEKKAPLVPPLYNQLGIYGRDTVVLVEGEKCAERLIALGIPATTAMGGSSMAVEKTDWSPLHGKHVILWPDNDEAGRLYMGRVAEHLRGRVAQVSFVTIPQGAPEKWDAADADDQDVVSLLEACAPKADAPRPRGMRFVSVEDLENLEPPEWLVDGLVPRKTFGLIVGPPASLKTFIALDWGLSIAAGLSWQEKAMGSGHVVYVAGEGHYGLAQRVVGWKRHNQISAPLERFHIVPQAVAMPTGQVDELIALIATLPEPPVLVILDTLARTFGGGDENSQRDMNAYVAAVDKLRDATGAAALVIHHTGKDMERGARGSTVLMGAVDMAVSIKREGERLAIRNGGENGGKQKDAEEHREIVLRAVPYRFETNRGVPASTIILTPYDPLMNDDGGLDDHKTPKQRKIMAMLEEAGEAGLFAQEIADRATKGNAGNARQEMKIIVEKGWAELFSEDGKMKWKIVTKQGGGS